MGERKTDLIVIENHVSQVEEKFGDVLRYTDVEVIKSEENVPFDDTSGSSVDPLESSVDPPESSIPLLSSMLHTNLKQPSSPRMSVDTIHCVNGVPIVGLTRSNLEVCELEHIDSRTATFEQNDLDSLIHETEEVGSDDANDCGIDPSSEQTTEKHELLDYNRNSIDNKNLDHLTGNMDCYIKNLEENKEAVGLCEFSSRIIPSVKDNDSVNTTGESGVLEVKRNNIELDSSETTEIQCSASVRNSCEITLPSISYTENLISATLFSKKSESKFGRSIARREITPLVIVANQPIEYINAIETKESENLCNKAFESDNTDDLSDLKETFENLQNKAGHHLVRRSVSNETREEFHSLSDCKDKLRRLNQLNIDVSRNLDKPCVSFYDDKSPEMQIVVNSLTPVLSRRRTNKNREKFSNENKENILIKSFGNSLKESKNLLTPDSDKSTTSEMCATWHGPTHCLQSQRPKMGIGMVISESTPLFSNNVKESLTKSSSFHSNGAMTMPKIFSKTILDAMHKKYCAHQYSRKLDTGPKSTLTRIHKMEQFVATHSVRRPPQTLQLRKDYELPSTSGNSSPALQRLQSPLSNTPASSPASEKKLNLGNNERYQAEIEAVEACKWLRATGFPQYAQLYEDGQFPVDVSMVEKDHDFLDTDSMQSLFRRLNTLNKCALMKINAHPNKKAIEESDEDDLCALSDRWEFQKDCRRWSRKALDPLLDRETVKSCSSHDSLLTDQDSSSQTDDSPVLDSKMPHGGRNLHNMLDRQNSSPDSGNTAFIVSPRLKRAASERIKSAKNLLKKMESLKSRKGKKFNNSNIVEISGPVVADHDHMQEKIQHLNCVDISHHEAVPELQKKDSAKQTMSDNSMLDSSYQNNNSACDTSTKSLPDSKLNTSAAFNEYHSAMSQLSKTFDSADLPGNRYASHKDDTNLIEIFFLPQDHTPGKFPKDIRNGYIDSDEHSGFNKRTGSFSVGRDTFHDLVDSNDSFSAKSRINHRRHVSLDNSYPGNRYSVYDNLLDSLDDTDDSVSHDNVSQDNVSQSTLDISTPSAELSKAQKELDMILHDLFENINGLNEAINSNNEDESKLIAENDEVNTEDQNVKTDQNETSDSCTSPNHSLHIETSSVDRLHIDTSSSLDPMSPVSPISPIEVNSVIDNSMDGDNDMMSNSSSSVAPSDQDIPNEENIPDDSIGSSEKRERRDSGVGSSLTRAPSDKKRKKIRWHSFQKCHRPSLTSRDLQINSLTVRQLQVLRKMSLLKLTSFMEKFCPTNKTTGWNWTVPRFMKRSKMPDYSQHNVFGIPLSLILQRTGQPLPQCILYAMRYLRHTAEDAVGIFRKSGVRSRIQKLRDDLEERPDTCAFTDLQAYDVADMFKQFFRELPECLLTVKLSETFISIFTYVQANMRMEAMQAAIILLPDENREVLQALLLFLSDIAQQSAVHQMTASNLAVCFGPSLFNIGGLRTNSSTPSPKPKHRKNLGVPDAKELIEQKAALECLTYMIIESKKLFKIPPWTYSRLNISHDKNEPPQLEDMYSHQNGKPEVRAFGEDSIQVLLKEAHEKNRGWINYTMHNGVDISYKKLHDTHPLREWKATVDIEAPPVEVLNRLLHERHVWDEDMLSWAEVEQISKNSDVFQYISNSMAPQPTRHYCILRYWRTDLYKGACAVVSTSVDHPDIANANGVRALDLTSHFLIEPCGAGKCRMTHLARTDLKGRNPEWYNKTYGFIIANYIERIRDSFHQNMDDSPETKV